MHSHSQVKMRISALHPTSQLNASKPPLGTILGTVFQNTEIDRFDPYSRRGQSDIPLGDEVSLRAETAL
jgi:hypothetical protein